MQPWGEDANFGQTVTQAQVQTKDPGAVRYIQ